MSTPEPLYRYRHGVVPEDSGASVLLVAMGGFIDAGNTQRQIAEHVLASHEHQTIASFDLDALYDYRGRRPIMTFDRDRWVEYDGPSLLVHRVTATDGHPFLLLTGAEPDYQWERVATDITTMIGELGVELTVSVHGIPMAVPHTRPIGLTSHGTNPALLSENASVFGQVQVPASLTALLEYRLGEKGRDAIGFAVHVPHYLGQAEFAESAMTGLKAVMASTGLALSTDAMLEAVRTNQEQITEELASNEEAAAIVAALERQYDTFEEGRARQSLLAEPSAVPSADEIGAEFEAFLKNVTDS